MYELNFHELYEELILEELFTDGELQLACDLCGQSVDTLNSCIYSRFGYHDYNQFIETMRSCL